MINWLSRTAEVGCFSDHQLTCTGILDKVKCEVLVLDGTAEMTFGAAKELYDSLPNAKAKDYILFDDNSTAQCHTQMGGYATGAEIIMDWLEDHI